MTPQEQAAFVAAYARNVAMIGEKYVADFVQRYSAGEDMDYTDDYASIVDALGMWYEATRWQMAQDKEKTA